MAGHIRRILIADNYDLVRLGLRTWLNARSDVKVVAEARDGRAALEAAREAAPDIAILEYALPGMNGIDLTAALKREVPRVEVLIYTMHQQEDLMLDAFRAGARGYVLKSDTERHLMAAIDALSLHRPYFSCEVSEAVLGRCLDTAARPKFPLTHREREIVHLIAEGRLNKQIAQLLDVSVKTVETHRAAAMNKLNIKNTAQLVRYALRNNLIQA